MILYNMGGGVMYKRKLRTEKGKLYAKQANFSVKLTVTQLKQKQSQSINAKTYVKVKNLCIDSVLKVTLRTLYGHSKGSATESLWKPGLASARAACTSSHTATQ